MPIVKTVGEQGPPYLFIHGLPSTHAVFRRVVERAPARSRCLLMDLPDHGEAGDAPDATLEDFERDIMDAIASVDEPVTAVAHSAGAYLLARVLPRVEARVERAVFLGGLPGLDDANRQGFVDFAQAMESGQLPKAPAIAAFIERAEGPEASEDVRHDLEAMVSRESFDRLLRAVWRLTRIGPDRWAAPFDTPALLLHGEQDQSVPFELGEKLAELSRNGELRRLKTRSHMLPVSHPDRIARAVFER